MENKKGKNLCRMIILSGLISFIVLALALPFGIPKLTAMINSLEESSKSGQRLVSMSIDLMEHMEVVLKEAGRSMGALEKALPQIQTQVGSISKNLKYWGKFSKSFVGVTAKLSDTYQETASFLPIDIPTGLETEYREVDLKFTKLKTPVGVKPKYTTLFEKQKNMLEDTAKELFELSKNIQETSLLMETGAHGMDKDLEKSLAAAQKELALAKKEIQGLTNSTIPEYLSEMRLQEKKLESSEIMLSLAGPGIYLGVIFLMLMSLLWAANGWLLLGLIDSKAISL